jgi:hypothetical protein
VTGIAGTLHVVEAIALKGLGAQRRKSGKIGSSGRTRTYNPPVNSPALVSSVAVFSITNLEPKARFGALSALNAVKFAVKFTQNLVCRLR